MTDQPRRPLGLYALVLIALTGVIVTGSYAWQMHELKDTIVDACTQRDVRDSAVTEAARLQAEAARGQATLSRIAANLPPEQMEERTRLFEQVAEANEAVVAARITRKCSDYR